MDQMRKMRDRSRKEESLWSPYQGLQDEKQEPITGPEVGRKSWRGQGERVQEGNADAAGTKAVRSQGR